jgi:hypothetical protein
MQARMRGLAQDAARRVASSIGTLQEVEGELHLQLDEMAPGMRLPPTAYYITRSLALDAELHPGFGLVAGQRVLVQWVGATPLIVDVLAAPGLTETLRFTPTSPAGGALTGDYPNPELAPDSVATAHIQAGAVTGSGSGAMLLASGGEPAIAPGAIGDADIADNAITTPKLANGAVTAAKQAIAVGGVLAGTLPNPTHAPGDHTFAGLVTVSRDAGAATPYTPHLELYTPNAASPGAAVWLRMRSAQGWSTAIGAVVGNWWHAFADSLGNVQWGWDGTRLRRGDDTAWLVPSYTNGYGAYSSPWVPGYRKMPDGTVRLRGLVTAGTQGTSAFTLPVGYRPANNQYGQALYACAAQGGVFRNDVMSNGQVLIGVEVKSGSWVAGGWVSISEMTFMAEA